MAHTFDTKAQITGTVDVGQAYLSAAYTCGSGATVLVLGIVVAGSTERAGGAPTFNGVAMVRADNVRIATEINSELWYLLAPPTESSKTISIPNSGTLTLYCCASSYKAQAGYVSILDVDGGSKATAANPSVTLTPTVAGDVIVAVCGDGQNAVPTGRTHETLYETDDGSYSDSHQYALIADTSETTVGWTVTSNTYGISAVAFREIASGGTAVLIQPSIADTHLRQGNADANYETIVSFSVSPLATAQYISLLSFDFSASVPAGAAITLAILRLYSGDTSTAGRTIACYRLRRTDWVLDEATWNHYKGTTDWGTAGALNTTTDHDTTDGATATSKVGLWVNWVVTAQVQYARDSVSDVAHFLLQDTGASSSVSSTYSSRQATDTNLCPKLDIYYTAAASAIKTVNGLAKASVKTRNGLAIASVKTWNGLA